MRGCVLLDACFEESLVSRRRVPCRNLIRFFLHHFRRRLAAQDGHWPQATASPSESNVDYDSREQSCYLGTSDLAANLVRGRFLGAIPD